MKRKDKKETLDKNRKLSKNELRRKEKLDQRTEQLAAEGYTRKDLTVSLITGSIPVYFLSLLMTLSGCGDMLILYTLFRYKTDCKDILIYDHPYEGGSIVFEK